MRTSPRLLLGLYAIVPLGLAVVAADVFWLDHAVRHALPDDPEQVRLFTVFFVLPHIVASLLLYLDADYARHYRTHLAVGLPAIAAGILVGEAAFGMDAVWHVYAVATVYHVLGQQFGVTRAMAQRTDRSHTAWKWISLVLALILYANFFDPELYGNLAGDPGTLWGLLGGLYAVTTVLAWRVARVATSPRGSRYTWANQALVGGIVLCGLAGYPFFAYLLPRFVHDCTAFAFYVPHDHNRNRDARHNLVYRALAFLPVPVVLLGPLLAIALAYGLEEWSQVSAVGFQVVLWIGFAHYYVESFGWKRHALPRQSIRIA